MWDSNALHNGVRGRYFRQCSKYGVYAEVCAAFFLGRGKGMANRPALETARRVQARRGRILSEAEASLLRRLWAQLTQSPTAEQSA